MATYKVPQDVEADDKLIGPFSFRQFIYLIIVVMAGAAAWGLAQLFIGLAIIPLPIIVFFGALALPLRKDQPMEIYLAAIVSFYLKPHKRLWDPEGIETLIEITAPKAYEDNRGKGLSQYEAEQRLSYLASIVDTGGWAIRGGMAAPGTSFNNDIVLEAQDATDVLDANNAVNQSFNQMMSQTNVRAREEAVEKMKAAAFEPVQAAPVLQPMQPQIVQPVLPTPTLSPISTSVASDDLPLLEFNPYPTNIQQTVIQPLNDPSHMVEQENDTLLTQQAEALKAAQEAAKPKHSSTTTSDTPVSADIINLVNNAEGLSVATLQSQGDRIHKKIDQESDEVVISLR
jgi:hypothetical protein